MAIERSDQAFRKRPGIDALRQELQERGGAGAVLDVVAKPAEKVCERRFVEILALLDFLAERLEKLTFRAHPLEVYIDKCAHRRFALRATFSRKREKGTATTMNDSNDPPAPLPNPPISA